MKSDIHHLEILNKNNYVVFQVKSYKEAKSICMNIGNIIHENDIIPNARSKSLTNSYKALDFHTDHHRANIIGIYCLKPSSVGGETIIIDSYDVLSHFNKDELSLLQTIYLYEHKIFENDPENYPLLEYIDNNYRIYYSYWLEKGGLSNKQQEVFNKFKKLTHTVKYIKFKLNANDFLLFDNRRMMHSRTEIKSGEERLLKRIWIELNTTKGE